MRTTPQETKLHMVTINRKTVFLRFPVGVRPNVSDTDIREIFGVQPGQCFLIG